MASTVEYNRDKDMIKCNNCNALIDRKQHEAKNGLCFKCRKEARK